MASRRKFRLKLHRPTELWPILLIIAGAIESNQAAAPVVLEQGEQTACSSYTASNLKSLRQEALPVPAPPKRVTRGRI
ncbi:hypothetical protein TMatcc_008813 [Talaromyces marneffei ATCC 18224]